MTTISLGYKAIGLTIVLDSDTDFVSSLINQSGSWPGGTALSLVFHAGTTPVATWPATIVAERASWHVPHAEVAALLATDITDSRLIYTIADGTTLVWARGGVVRSPR